MKKMKLFSIASVLFASILSFNCSSDNESEKINQVDKQTTIKENLDSSNFLVVEANETPEFSSETLKILGFSKFVVDSKKECTINLETNVVSLPYDSNLSEYNLSDELSLVDIGIKIAKKNVKPGSGCSSCVDCIGFRCGTSSVNVITKSELDNKFKNTQISNSREQNAFLSVDTKNHTVKLFFYNDIQLNNLK